jgi:hypothetical protein
MRIIWRILGFILSATIAFTTLYFVISLCVLLFLLTGQLTQGGVMFFEMRTPTYAKLLTFQVICTAVILACLALRKIVAQKLM